MKKRRMRIGMGMPINHRQEVQGSWDVLGA
jgi:hypothetical protein